MNNLEEQYILMCNHAILQCILRKLAKDDKEFMETMDMCREIAQESIKNLYNEESESE